MKLDDLRIEEREDELGIKDGFNSVQSLNQSDHIPDATKMVPDDRCRAEFEREFSAHDLKRDSDDSQRYAWVNVRCLWEGWQAAWEARSCARNQDATSQFCGEAVAMIAERARLRTALAQIADKDTYATGRGAFAQIANDALEGI